MLFGAVFGVGRGGRKALSAGIGGQAFRLAEAARWRAHIDQLSGIQTVFQQLLLSSQRVDFILERGDFFRIFRRDVMRGGAVLHDRIQAVGGLTDALLQVSQQIQRADSVVPGRDALGLHDGGLRQRRSDTHAAVEGLICDLHGQ